MASYLRRMYERFRRPSPPTANPITANPITVTPVTANNAITRQTRKNPWNIAREIGSREKYDRVSHDNKNRAWNVW